MYLIGGLDRDISVDASVDISVATRSSIDRVSVDTRSVLNQCIDRLISTDITIKAPRKIHDPLCQLSRITRESPRYRTNLLAMVSHMVHEISRVWIFFLLKMKNQVNFISKLNKYSRTSRKRPPKMSSLGGRLREVVAYEKLDNIGSKFCLISIW